MFLLAILAAVCLMIGVLLVALGIDSLYCSFTSYSRESRRKDAIHASVCLVGAAAAFALVLTQNWIYFRGR